MDIGSCASLGLNHEPVALLAHDLLQKVCVQAEHPPFSPYRVPDPSQLLPTLLHLVDTGFFLGGVRGGRGFLAQIQGNRADGGVPHQLPFTTGLMAHLWEPRDPPQHDCVVPSWRSATLGHPASSSLSWVPRFSLLY